MGAKGEDEISKSRDLVIEVSGSVLKSNLGSLAIDRGFKEERNRRTHD